LYYNDPENSTRGTFFTDENFLSIPAGGTDTQNSIVEVSGLNAGAYDLYFYADPTCLTAEANEDNNAYGPVTVNVGTEIDITIGTSLMGSYLLASQESQRVNYAGVDSGPVVVKAASGTPIIAALRDAYFVGGQLESFVQLMGLPQEQLSTKYYFPAYNNVTLDGQLRFGNVGTQPTVVTVTIGGVVRGTYPLDPGQAKRVNYAGLDTGPVVVESSGGVPIIAALRDVYYVDGRLESFAQLMGLPQESLSTKYYFPAYNNVTLDGQLRFGNVGTQPTVVTVTVAGVVRGTYPLNPSQAVRVNYAGLDSGPVVVESSGGVPITAALRDAYYVDGRLVSFVQLMGLPQEQLSTTYHFPAYNNVTLDGQLRFGNVGDQPTVVTVTIGGVVRGTYPLNPSEAKRVNYAGLDTGPVVVSSSGSVPIIAALRDAYFVNGKVESFAQLMGLPQELLSSAYFFPAYNNVTLDGQLRFGVP
jgi:butyrate kinase